MRRVVENEKLPFARFQQYLRDGFVPHPMDIQVSGWIGALAKWYFDFLKNVITVGALMALAKKTHSVPIYALGILSFSILNGYALSYISSWHFEAFHLFVILGLLLSLGSLFG
jgi:hypothetical protein